LALLSIFKTKFWKISVLVQRISVGFNQLTVIVSCTCYSMRAFTYVILVFGHFCLYFRLNFWKFLFIRIVTYVHYVKIYVVSINKDKKYHKFVQFQSEASLYNYMVCRFLPLSGRFIPLSRWYDYTRFLVKLFQISGNFDQF